MTFGRLSLSDGAQDNDLGVLARAVKKGIGVGFDLALGQRLTDLGARLLKRGHDAVRVSSLEARHINLRVVVGLFLRGHDGEEAKTEVQKFFDGDPPADDLLELLVVYGLEADQAQALDEFGARRKPLQEVADRRFD